MVVNDETDSQLLKAYAEHRSEEAFSELLHRHLDFTYGAALRMVRDPHLAEDVTQAVFLALARQAGALSERQILSGWLHRTAQNIAAQTVRTIERRRAREQEAAIVNDPNAPGPVATWEYIAPHLDDALGELNESDRDALLLRFFEKKSAREIGQRLGISDDAAQKRVTRAVERLRELFAKRGLTVGASGLVLVLSANAAPAAPAGLAVAISTAAALTGPTLAATTTVATQAIAMTTIQKTLVAATIAILTGVGLHEAWQAAHLRDQIDILQQQQIPFAEKFKQSQLEQSNAVSQLTALHEDNERLRRNVGELLKLRAESGLLRMGSNDVAQLRQENLELKQKLIAWETDSQVSSNMLRFQNPFLKREDWIERGNSDPLDALKTMLSAAKQGDTSKLVQLVFRKDHSESIDALIIPKRVWDTVTGVQVVDIQIYGSKTQRKAAIGTILQKEPIPVDSSDADPGASGQPPQPQVRQSMYRWFLVETNGQWLISGKG